MQLGRLRFGIVAWVSRQPAAAARPPPTGRAYHQPMLLVIDVGNSHVTVGLARDGALTASRRAASRASATADELEVLLVGLLRLDDQGLAGVAAVAIASTVPALTDAFEAIAARRGIPCAVAAAGTIPMAMHVDRPGDVGPDRLVNAYAAAHFLGTPAIVVDCGTATTFDAVDSRGAFVGGAIAPGLRVGLEALATRTARLPFVDLRLPDAPIGRDTASAIRVGTVLGHRAMIEGLLGRIRRELATDAGIAPHDVRAVLTGGLSVLPWARTIEGLDGIDPDLTLKGLVHFHRVVAGDEAQA
jgi:type III pantothenate kinase